MILKLYHRLKGCFAFVLSLTLSVTGTIAAPGQSGGPTEGENPGIEASSAHISQQNNIKVTGTVRTEKGDAMAGVAVYLKEGGHGVVTNSRGEYSIDVPAGSALVYSFMGYVPYETVAATAGVVDVVMAEDALKLDELVVIGYGSARKKDLTGGATSVGQKELNMVSTPNIMDRLTGQVAGLNVTSSSEAPGSSPSLLIRGQNSISASNNPLIILDGIPYSGSLSDIDPNIVDNMTVLKDASAVAIYGSRGSNGVILIQTKRGQLGKAQVSYKGQFGFAEPMQRIEVMGPNEYIRFSQDMGRLTQSKSYTGDETHPLYGAVISQTERNNYEAGITHNWQDYVFQTGFTMDHQVSVAGGTESTKYLAAIAYLDQQGVVYNSKLNRFNITANIDQTFNKWLTVGVGTQFIQRETGGITPNLEHAIKQSPYGAYKDEAGYYVEQPQEYANVRNPMLNVNGIQDHTYRNYILNAYANVVLPVDGLSFRTNLGYNYQTEFNGTYYGRDTFDGREQGDLGGGVATVYNRHYKDYTWENILRYDRQWGEHRFDATGLFSLQENRTNRSQQTGNGFVTDDTGYHMMGAASWNQTVSSYWEKVSRMSYMLRLNYGYMGKYLLTLTARRDGASVFGDNNKWGFFPSAAVAWNIAEENFVRDNASWMDMLKLRVSYGANGNEAIDPYRSKNRLNTIKYIWGDGGTTVTGAFLGDDAVGNPYLKWETTYTANVGIDFLFFRGRLGGTIDMYISNTHDLLMRRYVPIMNGYRRIWDNVGQTRNKGIEITLNSVNIDKKDFRWSTDFNFSLNRDKIVELIDGKVDDIDNKWFIGKPIKVIYDYKMIGLWRYGDEYFTTDADGNQVQIQKGAQPGDAKLLDADGNGIIERDLDKTIIGSTTPSFRMSMSNRFTYKNIYMSFLLNGVFGWWQNDNVANISSWTFGQLNYIHNANYWTPENDEKATIVSPGYDNQYEHGYYKRVNYVQLKNITLGYRFSRRLADKLHLGGIDINLGVNNVHTFSNVRQVLNYDNEWFASYPTARSYVLGINLTF